MRFTWCDYHPETMGYIETWLDADAVKLTGLDRGFRDFYEYWEKEDGFVAGVNFWCKVIFERDIPIAVVSFCHYEDTVLIMEILVDPQKRGQGIGTAVLTELLENEEILGFSVCRSEAVIFPNNIPSQKAFENAGFQYHHTHKDGDALYYVYTPK